MRHLRVLRYVDQVARAGSIRKAAEQLNLTASALNRRVMDLEEELGTLLFERRARGIRLTSAGEVFVRYLREQLADMERMKSQIEDLSGLRRGTIRLACSQALACDFLPRRIAAFHARYPLVGFEVSVLNHREAMAALGAFEVDLVLVFRPAFVAGFQPLMSLRQRLVALLPVNHPLLAQPTVRLSDCAAYPLALPHRGIGGRDLLDEACARTGLQLRIAVESNSFEFLRNIVVAGEAISFQIEIGAPAPENAPGLAIRAIDDRDIPRADLVFGQLGGRTLPVATAVFAEQLARDLDLLRPEIVSKGFITAAR